MRRSYHIDRSTGYGRRAAGAGQRQSRTRRKYALDRIPS